MSPPYFFYESKIGKNVEAGTIEKAGIGLEVNKFIVLLCDL